MRKQLLDSVMDLEQATWPEGTRGSRAGFSQRLSLFPEGFITIPHDGRLGGLSTSMIVRLERPADIASWEDVTSDGTIANHDPHGNALYVVSVGVHPDSRRMGIGQELVNAQVALAAQLDLDYVVLGSRLPEFHKYDGDIQSYMQALDDKGRPLDPEIRFYQRCGFEVRAIKANYMADDWESRNYGVIMVHSLRDWPEASAENVTHAG